MRRRPLLHCITAAVLGAAPPAHAAEAWFTTDTPVDVTGMYTQPRNILITQVPLGGTYSWWFPAYSLHPGLAITSLHAAPDYAFFFTTDAPFEESGSPGPDTRTIMLYQDLFISSWLDLPGLPRGTVIDGLSQMEGGGFAISFDVPTRVGAATYLPADVIRFTPPATYSLLWSGVAHGFGPGDNVDAIHVVTPTDIFFSFDERAVLEGVTLEPHEVARWTPGSAVKVLSDPVAFAPGENVASFTMRPFPGHVPEGSATRPGAPLTLSKVGASLRLAWGAPCAGSGIDGFGIYEGSLGSPFAYGHQPLVCTSTTTTTRDVTPSTGSRYYLIVPLGYQEGSYGRDSSLAERPPGAPRCRPLGPEPACGP